MVSASSLIEAAMVSRPTGPPANFSIMVSRSLRSISSNPILSTSSLARAAQATSFVIYHRSLPEYNHDALEQTVSDPRRAAGTRGNFFKTIRVRLNIRSGRSAPNDADGFFIIKVQPVDITEPIAERSTEQGKTGGGTNKSKWGSFKRRLLAPAPLPMTISKA